MFAGPLSDRFGRRVVLKYSALLYAFSAFLSAFAPTFIVLVIARMIGGIGVGISLILHPCISPKSPPKLRGKMVSFNQLNIVIGISVAFFTNYLIIHLASSDATWVETLKIREYNWRWMLGLEFFPAILYFILLQFVPQSPRWLIMKERFDDALKIMKRLSDEETATKVVEEIKESIKADTGPKEKSSFKDLLMPSMKLVMSIGIVVAVLQQITGINSVFFMHP